MEHSTFDIQPGIGGHRKTCQPISRKATMQSMLAFVHESRDTLSSRQGVSVTTPSTTREKPETALSLSLYLSW